MFVKATVTTAPPDPAPAKRSLLHIVPTQLLQPTPRQSPPPSPESQGVGAREQRSGLSSETLGGGTLQMKSSLSGDDCPANLSTLGPFCSLIGHRGAHPADVVLALRTAAGKMAFSDGKPGCIFDHHVQTAVCDSRAKYRESRRPRAVKVESLRFSSSHGQPT